MVPFLHGNDFGSSASESGRGTHGLVRECLYFFMSFSFSVASSFTLFWMARLLHFGAGVEWTVREYGDGGRCIQALSGHCWGFPSVAFEVWLLQ